MQNTWNLWSSLETLSYSSSKLIRTSVNLTDCAPVSQHFSHSFQKEGKYSIIWMCHKHQMRSSLHEQKQKHATYVLVQMIWQTVSILGKMRKK